MHSLLLGVFLLKTSLHLVFVADAPYVCFIKIQGDSIGFLLFEILWHVPVLRNTEQYCWLGSRLFLGAQNGSTVRGGIRQEQEEEEDRPG